MAVLDLSVVPETHRDLASEALRAAFGAHATDIRPVRGGASGALTYKVATSTGDHMLRMEANQSMMRNPTQYECMRIAMEVGIAPPAHYLDADAGVVVMPFIGRREIAEFGAPDEVAAATTQLLKRLHSGAPFPSNGDYFDNMRSAIAFLGESGRLAPDYSTRISRRSTKSSPSTRGSLRRSCRRTTIRTRRMSYTTARGCGSSTGRPPGETTPSSTSR
jgi:hypothetical protein